MDMFNHTDYLCDRVYCLVCLDVDGDEFRKYVFPIRNGKIRDEQFLQLDIWDLFVIFGY